MTLNLDKQPESTVGFPHHKRSSSEKGEKYFKECIEAGLTMANWNNDIEGTGVRASKKNKITNYNLYNDIVNKSEMERVMNPYGINVQSFPATYRNYPLLNPSINLLCGEERKRIFNPQVVAINADAATRKLNKIKETFSQMYVDKLMAQGLDEKKLERELQDFQKWARYSYKDMRERMGSQTLNYLYRTQDLKEEFSRGFKDLLIASEEISVIEIYGGEPRLRRGNPLNFHNLRAGESWKLEDSDLIIEDSYISVGEAIDRYYEYLKPSEIKNLEKGFKLTAGLNSNMYRNQVIDDSVQFLDMVGQDSSEVMASLTPYFGGGYDTDGNVRRTRVLWRGMRKLKILYYLDEVGELQKEILPEQYQPKTDLGEQLKEVWVNEWYEGTKLGHDIYTKMVPCEIQMRHRDNLSVCSPGIVGTTFNVNNSKGRGLMDIGKDYQYLWNTFWYRTELAFTKYKGKIGKLPLHLIPDFQDVNSALYFAEYTGWMLQDKFNESNRGLSKGKLAGAMNEGSDVIDLEMGNYITHHINMLNFIKQQVDDLTGITPQRRGAIDNRETVGGVERSVMQSSHVTEEWFAVHDNHKIRALRALLEAAKIAWEDESFVREFVLDDGTKSILEFDSDTFVESNYGIDISNSSEDMQTLQAMRQLGERIAQIEGGLSLVAEMYRTKDIASLQRKIQEFEENRLRQQQENIEAQREAEQQAQAEQARLEEEKLMLEQEEKELEREYNIWKTEQDNFTKITIAEINAYKFQEDLDQDSSGIADTTEIAEAARKNLQVDADIYTKQREQERKSKELEVKKETEKRKLELEKKKIDLEERKLKVAKQLQQQKDKAAMEREKLKGKIALKNKVVGEE